MKILYVATISDTINAFLIPHIEMLVSQGHQVDVACHVYQELDDKIKKMGCAIFDIPFDRSPIKIQNYKAYKILKEVISSQRYDIVHTHTPVASACVRLACRKMENVKVIYTAHGFHFFKGAPLINWLTYYPVERWLARYTDVLITINREDYDRANRLFNAGHISYIPGVGIDIQKYDEIKIDRTEKRRELGVPEDDDALAGQSAMGFKVIGITEDAFSLIDQYDMIVGIGKNSTRKQLQDRLEAAGACIPTLIHPNAVIGAEVEIGVGSVVMAGAVINCSSRIGKGCIINTGATVDHDNVIDDYVHISPGVHISGTVHIGMLTWLGVGSVISNNLKITSNCIIGAGAVVIRDLVHPGTYVGVPARRVDTQ